MKRKYLGFAILLTAAAILAWGCGKRSAPIADNKQISGKVSAADWLAQIDAANRDTQLRSFAPAFSIFGPATNKPGEAEFQKLKLDRPVIIDQVSYYGFRFTVPERDNHEDFVWAFVMPPQVFAWYLIPVELNPKTAKTEPPLFEDFLTYPRADYPVLKGMPPVNGRKVVLQHVSGDLLKDGKDYVIWFAFKARKPSWISLEFRFADLPAESAHDRSAFEKALSLQRSEATSDSSEAADGAAAPADR